MASAHPPWQQSRSGLAPFRATVSRTNRDSHATLIVDGSGHICSCDAAVEDILGASQSRLIGKRASAFIADLFREGSSPSYNARYLAYLGTNREWRRFDATDARGSGFVVEIDVSRRVVDDREVFVLDLRQPDTASS